MTAPRIHPVGTSTETGLAPTGRRLRNDTRVCVKVHNFVYIVCWHGIWTLHVCSAVYLLLLAELYWYLDRPFLTYYANLIQPESDRHFKMAGVAFGLVGVLHVWCALELMIVSYRAKELVLSQDDVSPDSTGLQPLKNMRSFRRRILRSTWSHLSRCSVLARLAATFNLWTNSWFGRRGVFGLESEFFDLMFLTRELVEIALQSYQAHQTSEMITTVWLNRFFVVRVTINCITTPLVQRVILRHPALGRLFGIAIDLGLSIGTNMVIPVIIFMPYLSAWYPDRNAFDLEHLYDDVWFTNMVMENRLLYVRSAIDFIAKYFPHLSILFSLSCIKTLIVRAGEHILPADDQVLQAICFNQPLPSMASQYPPNSRFGLSGWKTHVVHIILLLWGTALLGLHVSASLPKAQDEMGGCKETTRVWFATKSTCSTYEYNCFRRHDISLIDALGDIEPSTLLTLIISHCRDLTVPHEIQQFLNLLSVELFNVTLREWPTTAAISPTIHTSLVSVILAFVNMTALPDGLRGTLPASLNDIEIAYSNLTTLPDDLHDQWHALDAFYIECSSLQVFPSALTKVAVYDLSLVGNQIETVESLAQLPFPMFSLALSQNPIRVLPSRLHESAAFGYLSLEHTNLVTLPSWINDARIVEDTAFLKGSPVCGSSDQSLPALDAAAWPRVACGTSDPRGSGRYPLDVMLPRRLP